MFNARYSVIFKCKLLCHIFSAWKSCYLTVDGELVVASSRIEYSKANTWNPRPCIHTRCLLKVKSFLVKIWKSYQVKQGKTGLFNFVSILVSFSHVRIPVNVSRKSAKVCVQNVRIVFGEKIRESGFRTSVFERQPAQVQHC